MIVPRAFCTPGKSPRPRRRSEIPGLPNGVTPGIVCFFVFNFFFSPFLCSFSLGVIAAVCCVKTFVQSTRVRSSVYLPVKTPRRTTIQQTLLDRPVSSLQGVVVLQQVHVPTQWRFTVKLTKRFVSENDQCLFFPQMIIVW